MCSGARSAFSAAAEGVDGVGDVLLVVLVARKEAGVRVTGANPNTEDIRHATSNERSDNPMVYPLGHDKRAQKRRQKALFDGNKSKRSFRS
jgi:hypothetical protein